MIKKLKKFSVEIKAGRGDYSILPVELDGTIVPFEVVKTYFVISGETTSKTGQHAHIKEKELFLLLKGKANFISLDEKGNEYLTELSPGEAIYVPELTWHGFETLWPKTVIVAYSSTHHNPDRSDYIEDKEVFLKSGL